MKTNNISFIRMQKAEFPQFAKEMLQIIEKHNPEELKLHVVNNLLAETLPALQAMKVRQSKHELTVPLNAKHTERCANANMLLSLLNVYLRDSDRLAHAKKVENCIRQHLTHISRLSVVKVSENFEMFFATVESDNSIGAAFDALGLSGYVQKAKAAHNEYKVLNEKRRIDMNKKAEKTTAMAKALVSKNARTALQVINSAVLMYPDVDYSVLIAELNALISQFKVKLKARRTRSANKLLKTTTAASSTKTVAAAV